MALELERVSRQLARTRNRLAKAEILLNTTIEDEAAETVALEVKAVTVGMTCPKCTKPSQRKQLGPNEYYTCPGCSWFKRVST